MSSITHLTSLSQLDSILAKDGKTKLVVIDFHATWCGPCHVIAPTYEKLANQYKDRSAFLKCDVDACQEVAKKYAVSAMPTFIFLKNGSKVDQVRGANASALESTIKRHIPTSSSGSFPASGGHVLGGSSLNAPSTPASSSDDATVPFPNLLDSLLGKPGQREYGPILMIGLVCLLVWFGYRGSDGHGEFPDIH